MKDDVTNLYICPYCKKGRFTAKDGWNGAVKHIKENHNGNRKRASRRGRPPRSTPNMEDLDLLEEASFR